LGFYFHRIPTLIQKVFPNHLWFIPNTDNKIYLTFDDGPSPQATNFVLESLAYHQAKATFFWLGESAKKHPNLVLKAQKEGHRMANHGYAHLDGWKISREKYEANESRGKEVLKEITPNDLFLFRSPYGHFRKGQKDVMWSLMSGDFDSLLSKEICLKRLISKIRSGDIVVFHDNEKSFEKLKWVLPKFLKYCQEAGFKFDLIPERI